MHGRPALALLLVTLLLPAPAALAQTADELARLPRAERVRLLRQRTWDITARRTQSPIVLDGRLSEADWELAVPIAELFQIGRNEGLLSSERTEVRVLYDADNIYVGFRAWDSDPEKMRIRSVFRDESGGADDLVAVMLDAYHGHRNAIQFVTNANGLTEDLLQAGETTSTRNHDWDAVWNSSGRILDDGFEVEMAVPFKSLRFEPPGGSDEITFGIGFKRNIPRRNEESVWPFVPNDSTWYRPAELGHLRGLSAIQPGRNFELRPYILGGGAKNFLTNLPTDYKKEAGIDAKWGVTTGITADFTVNTDFAQEEADVQQTNLTRFSLFFPEKRQFFLEGQQAFRFGVPREADLIFTRRIGLSDSGTPIRIWGGARISGRQGRTSIGVMNLQVDDDAATASENFTVLRLKRDFLSRSSVGAMFTNVQGGGEFNRVYGADVSLYTRQLFFDAWAARVDKTNGGQGRNSGYTRAAYESDRRAAGYTFLGIGQGFDPGVGFVRRPDSRQHDTYARWSPRPSSDLIRQVHTTARLGYITNGRSTPETREREVEFRTDFETGDATSVKFTNAMEHLLEPFQLRPGILLQAGTYKFNQVEVKLDSFRRRHLQLDATIATGGFYDGDRDTLQLNFNWRFTRTLGVTSAYTVNWVDLPQGAFTTQLVSSRVQMAFSNNLGLFTLLQYNHDSKQFSSNVRFNWIPKPGTDFFIVYNESDGTLDRWTPRNRSLTVKLNYLFAL